MPVLTYSDIVSITFVEQQEQPIFTCLRNEKTPNAHRLHHVLLISTQCQIVAWMRDIVLKSGEKLLVSKTVKQVPNFFKSSVSANQMQAKQF